MRTPSEIIYLDFAATTPVDPRVLEKMLPFFSTEYGNSSSIHPYGQVAEFALENSREVLAECLNCSPKEVVFTSCGSESDNLALRGVAFAAKQLRTANHILISSVEHHAVSRTVKQLHENFGFEVELIPVDRYGMVSPDDVRRRLRKNTAVVSVIYANNEIGTINPISQIGEKCKEAGIPLHIDAVQAAAYLPVDVESLNVDLLSLGAHKFYGPKGVGALFIRKNTPILPMQTGGSQEFGLRAGTHNIPYIVALAEALRLSQIERQERTNHVKPLRDKLIRSILNTIQDSHLTGHPTTRLPNHSSFVFKNLDGNSLLIDLGIHGYAVSSGSACKTGDPEPSDILLAMGFDRDWALGSLRVTLGSTTTNEQIERFLTHLPELVLKN